MSVIHVIITRNTTTQLLGRMDNSVVNSVLLWPDSVPVILYAFSESMTLIT